MKQEDQVISIEIAKKLKELGVTQDSLYYWNEQSFYDPKDGDYTAWVLVHLGEEIVEDDEEIYSAFTVAELGRLIPYRIGERFNDFTLRTQNERGVYLLSYEKPVFNTEKGNGVEHLHSETGDTEAEVRGKMLIWINDPINTK